MRFFQIYLDKTDSAKKRSAFAMYSAYVGHLIITAAFRGHSIYSNDSLVGSLLIGHEKFGLMLNVPINLQIVTVGQSAAPESADLENVASQMIMSKLGSEKHPLIFQVIEYMVHACSIIRIGDFGLCSRGRNMKGVFTRCILLLWKSWKQRRFWSST